MMQKPKNLYEINTATYLSRLTQAVGSSVTLATIPDAELQLLATRGIDSVWFMGVWARSPRGVAITRNNADLMDEFRTTLPDYCDDDLIGSAYSIHDYHVDQRFGGDEALMILRDQLHRLGLKLILDFVPNHTALDHPWISAHPDYYITGTTDDITAQPDYFAACGDTIIANGRDPHYPAWQDTAQVNAFAKSYRHASIETLSLIATLCDGVRCDMAMLLLNDIFAKTWGQHAGTVPSTEYWTDIITSTRREHPDFVFIAEAYWQTEATLVDQGFDYCYDKTLYDLLLNTPDRVDEYLTSSLAMTEHMVHFIENHDEQRAATAFSRAQHEAAARRIASLPGLTMWHDGQWQGRKIHIPVQLGRCPEEASDTAISDFYDTLLPRDTINTT